MLQFDGFRNGIGRNTKRGNNAEKRQYCDQPAASGAATNALRMAAFALEFCLCSTTCDLIFGDLARRLAESPTNVTRKSQLCSSRQGMCVTDPHCNNKDMDINEQLEIIKRGCDELIVEAELVEKLESRPAAAGQGRIRSRLRPTCTSAIRC